ncbi:hypothetical protein [Bdellovibrio sp. HCB209]|uniref:hypothetical protein n=1 Tax=Bdellovibrio sp. HCB209 TaxID=3394354 RepID=UPI0039B54A36
MSLTSLIFWCLSIITAIAGVENIDVIQRSILRAQANLVYESRTSTWGSPNFLGRPVGPSKSEKWMGGGPISLCGYLEHLSFRKAKNKY